MSGASAATENGKKMPTTAETVVRNFYKDWGEVGFKEAYIRHLHPDVVLQNTGRPDREGIDAVLGALEKYIEIYCRPFAKVTLLHLATEGDSTVITERTEHCFSPDHDDTHDGHFASVFEIEDGKIRRWAEFWGDDPAAYSFGSALPRPETYRKVSK
ncbi:MULTISPECIES: nuclear transport factor 2 family protein [Microbacterium]|jgi:limonene-1,2-epoxide hydrolase|uniref:nuclear transport factor 2 family protein n=1 Tax=Microbacterium TaxID=33882 RepID=UPI0023DA557B|nr:MULTISPECIES: nuclear transport factor 2 family protein [Microbacterium]MDF2046465.1 nuclear transport factor 2 family protein [Microbacterium sp. Kw_RZR3]MDF2506778.1 hypothetical protein [Microbacterium sp.]MDQ1075868.1 limonene-1,2-epoxide hydrolase [Microbacterium sp. SORGH_AS_0969]MDQ1116113.1 limonene-1,2-epoxide hydrolase [Microbacterium testaceum]